LKKAVIGCTVKMQNWKRNSER
jgi:hypothetical protein